MPGTVGFKLLSRIKFATADLHLFYTGHLLFCHFYLWIKPLANRLITLN